VPEWAPADWRERLAHPREGWVSLALLAVMLIALGWSVQGANWLEHLDFLVPVALYGVVVGSVLGMLRLHTALALGLGSVLGTFVVVWTIGSEYFPDLSHTDRFEALGAELRSWIRVVIDVGYPIERSPYALGLGVIMWTTAYIAGRAVFRYGRAVDAIALVGVAIVANMSATYTDLFGQLLLFVSAALGLWLRASLSTRQESWQRRRVNENLEVPASIIRSGVVFSAGTIALAWVLTSVAVAAPLTGAWRSLETAWTDVRDQFEGVFGTLTNPNSRISGTSFGDSFTVTGTWFSRDDEVMLIAASRAMYMRTTTYDVYSGIGWSRSESRQRAVDAAGTLFPGETPERPTDVQAFDFETITVEMRKTLGRNVFVPGYPVKVFLPVVIHEPSNQPLLGGLDAASPIAEGQAYQTTAALSRATEAQLSAAGTEYPASVTALYLDASLATDRVRQLALDIVTAAGATTRYEQAKALARYLRTSQELAYSTNAPMPPRGQDLVDFFLFEGRAGYCQYYASAMALMARTLGIPARVASGFAPGEAADEEGTFLVRDANAHAWAELYFPGYGWQIFEATKTIDPVVRLSGGAPLTRPPTTIAGVDDINDLLAFENSFGTDPLGQVYTTQSFQPAPGAQNVGGSQATSGDGSREGNGIIFVMVAAVLLGAFWFRSSRMQRRWRFMPPGDRAWMRLSLAADRAGVAPRPSETVYEYAGWLEEQIPTRRPEIRTLADGKVWQDYSGRRLSSSAAARIEAAWQRLRIPLVILTLRRWFSSLVRRRI
jgi:hypothetical protein